MIALTDEEKIALQKSWEEWVLDLIERRFYNNGHEPKWGLLIHDTREHPIILYEDAKKRLIEYVKQEGYGK